jgi:hypothetical protein
MQNRGTEHRDQNPLLVDATMRRLAIIGAAGIIACIVSRAPTLLQEVKIPVLDVKLGLNAGYVLVFGPLLVFFAAITVWYLTPRTRLGGAWTISDRQIAAFLFVLPVVIAAFLTLQFFLLLAPPGTCPTFDRWRYLTDFHLEAFQPEYCVGLPSETQKSMPWLIDPPILQGWVQVALPALVALVMGATWHTWLSKHQQRRQ